MAEKEITVDLSGKIKFSDTLYMSIGTLLLSGIIAMIQVLFCLANNGWAFTPEVFVVLLNFVFAIRGENKEDGKENV